MDVQPDRRQGNDRRSVSRPGSERRAALRPSFDPVEDLDLPGPDDAADPDRRGKDR